MNGFEFWLLVATIVIIIITIYKIDKYTFNRKLDDFRKGMVLDACREIREKYGIVIYRTGDGFTISNPPSYNQEGRTRLTYSKITGRFGATVVSIQEDPDITQWMDVNNCVNLLNEALRVEKEGVNNG